MNVKTAIQRCIYLIILSIILFSFTACQPTPEKEIVINKNDGQLEEIIAETTREEEEVKSEEKWEDAFSTKDGEVTFKIDAVIFVPDSNKLPVAYISPKNISQETADRVLNTLIGENILYAESDELTKREIDIEIRYIEYSVANEYPQYKESDSEEYEYLMNRATKRLRELYAQYESAPELPRSTASMQFSVPDGSEYEGESNPLVENGTLTQQQVQANEEEQLNGEQVIKGEADLGKERFARLEIYKYSTVNQGIWFKNAEMRDTTALDAEVESISEPEAIGVAESVLESMGIEGFGLYQTGYSKVFGDYTDEEKYAYKFLFKRVVNSVSVSHVEQSRYSSGGQMCMEQWDTESIYIAVDDTGLLSFEYSQPIEINEIANENVAILSFDEIKEIFKKQMQINYAWNVDEHILSQTVTINRIELGLAMVARKDSAGYMLIPAWNFYGYDTYTYDEQQPGGWQLDENNQVVIEEYGTSFLTVNAINGSLIDNSLSY